MLLRAKVPPLGRRRLLFLIFLLLLAGGCSHKPQGKRYELQGRVVAVDAGSHEITVAHEDVPGLMKGMTMPFVVGERDRWIFNKIAPGDNIHATLVLSDHAELDNVSFTEASPAEGDGTSGLRIPQPGDEVPDFALLNQSGKAIHLQQFRGKPLLLTFIYTQCPFPEYCLRMSGNFSQVLKQLHQDPKAFAAAQLLSISIDPDHDKPAVLRAYGRQYVGSIDPGFAHWQFASGTPDQVRTVANFFGLAYNSKDGQIVHGLRTVLIGSDGKVLKVYSGGDWKPNQVAEDFIAAGI